MNTEYVFVLWAMKAGNTNLIPSGFALGSVALFWAEMFATHCKCDVLVDAVPTEGFYRHMAYCEFAAQVSEESFYNAYRNLESFCHDHGGFAEGSGMARGFDADGIEL